MTKRMITFAVIAGIAATLAIGHFFPVRQQFIQSKDLTPASACLIVDSSETQTSRGMPFPFLKQIDGPCTPGTETWLPSGLISDILIWTAAAYLIAIAYLKLFRTLYKRVK